VKVLAAAFCCAPGSGSEQAFGWWWLTTCARTHEVVVLTPRAQQAVIESAGDLPPGLSFVYVDGPRQVSSSGSTHRLERVHQYLWALRAIRPARRVAREWAPDVAQQVTTGTWRVPSPLAFTDVPLVLGPLAGSERIPPQLFRSLGWRGYVVERVRAVQMGLARLDPLVRFTLRRAAVILAAGPGTYDDLSARYPGKVRRSTRAFAHPRIDRAVPPRVDAEEAGDDVTLCWIGRLVQGKGLELLLTALTDERLRRCRLDVYGDGDRARYATMIQRLGLGGRVVLHGHAPQADIFRAVRDADLFVFTSLRELMGQAMSEAMQLGAACVILDWSGPSQLVGPDGALKVPVSDIRGTTRALTEALVRAVEDPALRRQLREAARQRIAELVDPARYAETRDDVLDAARSAGR
jgi:glycosyltransferase involved in cell wall biosynthesis